MAVTASDDFIGSIGGIWTQHNTGGLLTIQNNRLLVSGGLGTPTAGDPGLVVTASTARSALGGFGALVRLTNSGGIGPMVGLLPAITAGDPAANGAGLSFEWPDLTVRGVILNRARMRSIDYLWMVIPRPTAGYWVLLSGGIYGTFPTATLLWAEPNGTSTPLYSHLAGHSSTWHADYAKVVNTASLPAAFTTQYGPAIAYDTFTRANGNLSGSTTESGGLVWAVNNCTAAVASNKAALTVASAEGVAAVSPATQPRIVECKVTRGATGNIWAGMVFRADPANLQNNLNFHLENTKWQIAQSGVGGVDEGSFTPVAGTTYHLMAIDYGTTVFLFIDGVLKNPGGLANTYQNTMKAVGFIRSSGADTGNTVFDDLACYAPTVTAPSDFGAFPSPPAGTGTPISTDTFTAANGTALTTYDPAWTVRVGTWNIQSNRAQMTTAGVQGIITRSTGAAGLNHESRADITVPVTTPAWPIDWGCGVVVRYTDANNYLWARLLYQDTSNEIELWENNAGTEGLVGYINLGTSAIAPGSTHNLRLAVVGNEAACYLDGDLALQATTGLLTGTTAGVLVRDNTPSGQPSFDNVELRATSTGPVISAVTSSAVTSSGATISWTTDQLADSQVEYGLTTAYGTATTLTDTSPLVASHSRSLTGLAAGTLYHYRALSRNAAGVLSSSADGTFTTTGAAGAAPVISGIASIAVTSTAFTAVWTTDIASDSQVEYGTTVAYGSSTTLNATPVTSHSVTVSGLTPNTLYHWRPRSGA